MRFIPVMRLFPAAAMLMLMLLGPSAMAQDIGPANEPAHTPWITVVLSVVLVVLVAIGSFMSPKRGHQD